MFSLVQGSGVFRFGSFGKEEEEEEIDRIKYPGLVMGII
jgi:hypothetical protein